MSDREKARSRLLRDNAFRNVVRHEPERVAVTRKRHGEAAAKAMAKAIALDEARRQGVKIP